MKTTPQEQMTIVKIIAQNAVLETPAMRLLLPSTRKIDAILITITKAQLDWKQVLKLPLKTSTQTFELVSRRQILDEQLIVTAIVYKLLGKPYSNDSLFTQVLQLCSRTIQNYLYERANSEENLVNRAQIMNLQVWKLYLVIKTLLSTIKRPKFIFSKATKALCVLLFEISKAFLR